MNREEVEDIASGGEFNPGQVVEGYWYKQEIGGIHKRRMKRGTQTYFKILCTQEDFPKLHEVVRKEVNKVAGPDYEIASVSYMLSEEKFHVEGHIWRRNRGKVVWDKNRQKEVEGEGEAEAMAVKWIKSYIKEIEALESHIAPFFKRRRPGVQGGGRSL